MHHLTVLHLDPSTSHFSRVPLNAKSANSKFDAVLEDFKTKLQSDTRNKSGDDGEFNLRDQQLLKILKYVNLHGEERQEKKEKETALEEKKLSHEKNFNMAKPRVALKAFSDVADAKDKARVSAKDFADDEDHPDNAAAGHTSPL